MTRQVEIKWSNEDKVYVVHVFCDKGTILMTHGDTLSHAFEMGKEALDLHDECLAAHGE